MGRKRRRTAAAAELSVDASDVALTQGELASAFGVARTTVQGWLAHKSWSFPKSPPWSLFRVARWHGTHIAKADRAPPVNADADPSAISRDEAERRRSQEQAAILRIKRLVLESEFISRDRSSKAMIRWTQIALGKVADMVESLAPVLCPDDPAYGRRILRDWYDRFCADLEAITRIDLAMLEDRKNGERKNPAKVKAVRKRHSKKGKA